MFYQSFTGKSCFPLPVAISGTFSSEGVNVTTNIASDLRVGDYLYSTVNNELREVITNASPTRYTIKESFSVNAVNEAIKITDKTVSYTKASVFNLSKVDGLFNGFLFAKRTSIYIDSGVIVFTIDATGGANISVLAT